MPHNTLLLHLDAWFMVRLLSIHRCVELPLQGLKQVDFFFVFFEVSDLSSVQQGCGKGLHELTLQKWAGQAWPLKVLESFVDYHPYSMVRTQQL